MRSPEAQAVIERYTAEGRAVPKNGSMEALHCDHVNVLRATDLARLQTTEDWLAELPRLKEVVCVTADENYRLQQLERQGADGWGKYATAGIVLISLADLGA